MSSTELSAALALASWPLAASKIAIALQGGSGRGVYRGANLQGAREGAYREDQLMGGAERDCRAGLQRGPECCLQREGRGRACQGGNYDDLSWTKGVDRTTGRQD